MANQRTSNPNPMNNMDDYQSSQKADIQFLMNELSMPMSSRNNMAQRLRDMKRLNNMRGIYKDGGKVNKPEMTAKQRAQLMLEGLKRYKGKKKKNPNKKAKK